MTGSTSDLEIKMSARSFRGPVRLSDMFSEARLKEVTSLLGDDNEAVQSLKSLIKEEQTAMSTGTGGSVGRVRSSKHGSSTHQPHPPQVTPAKPDRHTPAPHSPPPFVPTASDAPPMCDEQLLIPERIPNYEPFPVEHLPAPIQQSCSGTSLCRPPSMRNR